MRKSVRLRNVELASQLKKSSFIKVFINKYHANIRGNNCTNFAEASKLLILAHGNNLSARDINSNINRFFHSVCVTMSEEDARAENEKAVTGQDSGASAENNFNAPPLTDNLDGNKKQKKKGIKPVHVYWNPEQLEVLKNWKNYRRVLFHNDFGVGKTLLLKEVAKYIARENTNVYFVSLGKPSKFTF